MSQETHQQPAEISLTPGGPEIDETLQTLASLGPRIDRVIAGRSRESLQQPGEDGRWGVIEVLCHLRDWELVFHEWVRRTLEEDRPRFEAVDTTMWPLEHDYRGQDSIEVFEELAAHRQGLIERLRETDRGAWERTGVMEDGQEVSLRGLIEMIITHDDRYLQEAREAVR